ncbi:hypothetical protein DL93DRAFT_2050051, partial [Clavulina sp. PMI_390]
MLRALLVAYVLGGVTMIPLLVLGAIAIVIYTSTPVGDPDPTKPVKARLEADTTTNDEKGSSETSTSSAEKSANGATSSAASSPSSTSPVSLNQRPIQGWIVARRTFFETPLEGSYMNQMVRSFLDARSKDPKRARPRDTFYAVLKGSVLFLYEDEGMSDCWAAIDMPSYNVSVFYPNDASSNTVASTSPACAPMMDGEMFSKRNAIALRLRTPIEGEDSHGESTALPTVSKDMTLPSAPDAEPESLDDDTKPLPTQPTSSTEFTPQDAALEQAFDQSRPWFLFFKSTTKMEDWYLSLLHNSNNPGVPPLTPLLPVFSSTDMALLVSTIDQHPDPIPMRWLNALIGRLFFGVYRTARLEEFIVSRFIRKLAKVKRPSFLSEIIVREASLGHTAPILSRPMLKELTKEGEASVELGLYYKGEIKIIIETAATINLGTRFKSYTVKLLLAIVLKEMEGNLLVRVKSPPSNRLWYTFTSMPKTELEVLPVVSDRQIKWSMILKPIENMLRESIQDSVVMPNMDDIPFFDSTDFPIRGGIFADAKRKERSSTLEDEGKDPLSTDSPGHRSTASFSGVDTGELVITGPGRADTTSSLPNLPLGEEKPSVASTSSSSSSSTSSSNRRSGWFSSPKREQKTRPESTTGDSIPPSDVSSLATVSEVVADTELLTPTPKQKDEPSLAPPDIALSDAPPSPTLSATSMSTSNADAQRLRSPSTGSHKSTRSVDLASWLSASRSSTKVDSDDGSEDDRPAPRTSAASALIANLKTKAAEKQLASSAREAMKKWGWGTGRKSTPSPGTNSPSNDDVETSPLSRSTSSRPTYAEMRAKVEERHNLSRSPAPSSTSTGNMSDQTSANTTVGRSSELFPRPSEAASSDSSMGGYSLEPSAEIKPSTQPLQRQPTMPANLDVDPSVRGRTLSTKSAGAGGAGAPVFASQPSSAAMMTIPGIHASHRNQVMALGNTPKPPPPLPPRTNADGTPIVPRIGASLQNVYRMFNKNESNAMTGGTGDKLERPDSTPSTMSDSPVGTAGVSAPVAATLSRPQMEPPAASSPANVNEAPVPISPETDRPSPAIVQKRAPPPLPPRKSSTLMTASPPPS